MNVTTGTLCSSKPEAELEDQGALPPGWVLTTLGEAFVWGSGGTPKRSITEYFGGCIPWAVIGDLKDGTVSGTSSTITNLGLANSSARMVPAGSVLLAMYGSIGKLGIAGTELTTNQAIAFTKTDPIHNKYLFWYLRFARNELVGLGRGDTQSNISQTVIKGFPFILAPLPEQRRIVAEIEKHFTRLDAAESALRRVGANLRRYRASVLKAACEGKLVPTDAELAKAEGRDYEHAGQLLERILAERRARWESQGKRRRKYKEPVPPEISNLPESPEGWVWATVGQIGEIGEQTVLTGPFGTNLKKEDFTSEGVPVVTIGCLTEAGLNLEKAAFVSKEKAKELVRYGLRIGDLLFSRMATVGRAGIVGQEADGCLFNYHLMRLRIDEDTLLPQFYIAYVRGSSQVSHYVKEVNHGATRDGINTIQLLEMPVSVPPLCEQYRIVAEVESRLSIIQQAETTVEVNLKRVERLRQSILKQAYSGRLVPQDPEDEPASALLERIREERAVAEAAKPKRKLTRRRSKTSASSQLALLDSEP